MKRFLVFVFVFCCRPPPRPVGGSVLRSSALSVKILFIHNLMGSVNNGCTSYDFWTNGI